MSLYRRGDIWWYKFKFAGQTIRESSRSTSKTLARDAERARRHQLEVGFNRIPQRKQAPLFSTAAREWLAEKAGLSPKTKLGYEQRINPVLAKLGQRLLCDVGVPEVVQYRNARLAGGAANRTINYEVGCIRGVLKKYGLWAPIAERKLRENHDVGRAISHDHESRLLNACRVSKAPSLLPLFIFAHDTGLRASEIRATRRRDLTLDWKAGVIVSGGVIVPRSKTEAGTGRSVPFTQDVCSTLTLWLSRFAGGTPDSYVFPRHKVQMLKGGKETRIVSPVLSKPMQSWQRAWRTALKRAGVQYRWHDLRHTFVTRLAENPNVSEQTIRALAGHVSKQMLERYSHIRTQAKQDAIASLRSAGAALGRKEEQGSYSTQ